MVLTDSDPVGTLGMTRSLCRKEQGRASSTKSIHRSSSTHSTPSIVPSTHTAQAAAVTGATSAGAAQGKSTTQAGAVAADGGPPCHGGGVMKKVTMTVTGELSGYITKHYHRAIHSAIHSADTPHRQLEMFFIGRHLCCEDGFGSTGPRTRL